jgi:hypothetical protein
VTSPGNGCQPRSLTTVGPACPTTAPDDAVSGRPAAPGRHRVCYRRSAGGGPGSRAGSVRCSALVVDRVAWGVGSSCRSGGVGNPVHPWKVRDARDRMSFAPGLSARRLAADNDREHVASSSRSRRADTRREVDA